MKETFGINKLVDEVSTRVDLPKKRIHEVLTATIDVITKEIQNERRIFLPTLGTFHVKMRKPKVARNPKTGEPIQVPAQKYVFFKASHKVKESLNLKK